MQTESCEVRWVDQRDKRGICCGNDTRVQLSLGRNGVLVAIELGTGDIRR